MFIGYDSKGYKILDPTRRKVYLTRDVRFVENQFTTAAELREQLRATDDAEDEDDDSYYESLSLANEIELAKRISLEDVRSKPPPAPGQGSDAGDDPRLGGSQQETPEPTQPSSPGP